ncbi:VOC family protein [Chondromyces crocatus]|uniref:Glyoxalase n=1 Tax=Chondromyces crocatus TaxID=52 RepID=A0A0K1ESZ5_CHOCO|nr:VOC family protein [Chondromyces crocatus]AKT43986.1 glyoxalase [Chondromyces crocatus]
MTSHVSPIPEGYESAIPYLIMRGASDALAFYAKAFGAVEVMKLVGPDGKLGHAEMMIGRARFSLADEYPEMNIVGPQSLGGTSVSIQVYVEDVDAICRRAKEAGAKILQEPKDEFYGDRTCKVEDPFGHVWLFQARNEVISIEEMDRRFQALFT